MNTSDVAQVFVTGIAVGSIYSLMGMGLFITYLTTKAMNFGQGDFLMIAAFLSMSLAVAGVPAIAAIPAVFLVLVLLGVVLERVAIRPLSKSLAGSAGSFAWILTTLGFGMLLQNTATIVWGKSSFYSPPLFSSGEKKVVNLFGAGLYLEEIVVAIVALLVLAALYWFLFRTRAGKEISAVAFDKATAALLGINVRRTVINSYVMMALLAATSGVLAGPITTVQSHMGLLFILKGFAVVSIGGFVNPIGILIGGISFGIMEGVSNYFESQFGDLYPYLIVLAFLIVRPSGLFGEARADVR
jgi:branched-chain amino acid transport system permease protein